MTYSFISSTSLIDDYEVQSTSEFVDLNKRPCDIRQKNTRVNVGSFLGDKTKFFYNVTSVTVITHCGTNDTKDKKTLPATNHIPISEITIQSEKG